MKCLATASLFLCFCLNQLGAQDIEDNDLNDFSLEELMNIPIEVSKTDLSLRESPAVLSVITRKEIQSMGARDLMDVLNQVPGFNFGMDVLNVVGIAARGNWAHEGKLLLLIDGLEMNEPLFTTTQFGQHYDIKNIDRIEIIRGPGSSIYGGYAELGVVNIITRKGNNINGVNVQGQIGFGEAGIQRQDFGITIGSGSNDVNYSISGNIGSGQRSIFDYTDITGNTINLKNNNSLRPLMINSSFNYKNVSTRIIYDGYYLNTVDQFGDIAQKDKLTYNTLVGDLKYDRKVGANNSITTRLAIKSARPWNSNPNAYLPYEITVTRYSPSVNANFNPSDKVNLIVGMDSYFDNSTYIGDIPDYFGEGNYVHYFNLGAFAQSVFKSRITNVTIGARFDRHSQFGSAFSPRIGATKIVGKFHVKMLYSRAFRAPAIENINYNNDIQPERTGVAEVEIGFKPNDQHFITANIYDITISDPIVYEGTINTYYNFDRAGSRGVELEYKINGNWGYGSINYAYYNAAHNNRVPLYSLSNHSTSVIGIPAHRINFTSNVKLSNTFSLNCSANLIGDRFAITGLDAGDNYIYSRVEAQAFINLFLNFSKGNIRGGLGVFDFFDEKQSFIQPYASGHTPLPGLGREFNLKLGYTIPFK